jgi:hypothetical protein
MAKTKAGPYIKTARAKKTPGKTVAVGGTQVIKAKGKKPLKFKKGGLHASTDTPQGEKISATKMRKALAGGYGGKAQKQARFAKDVLAKGQRTAKKGKK